MNYRKFLANVATAGLLVSGSAQAGLINVGNGQLEDTVTGLVWLQNANLAATNTFGVAGINASGTMWWGAANNWIAAMNAADYLGHNDWMLPTTSPVNGSTWNINSSSNGSTDVGTNITSQNSELAYMFNVDLAVQGNAGLVSHLQSGNYWSGTLYTPRQDYVWEFRTSRGDQGIANWGQQYYVWAVRPADASVPEPTSLALGCAGLGLLGFVRRRRCVATH